MDKGVLAKTGYEVRPGQDGSFVVLAGGLNDEHRMREMWGFSNSRDLIAFLAEEHAAETETSDQP